MNDNYRNLTRKMDLCGVVEREAVRKSNATSAVNDGPAGKATSDRQFPAARVDGQGGEPSAVANMSVAADGYDDKKAPRGNAARDPLIAYYLFRNTRHWNT